jgi:hypothetical protein
MAPCGKGAGFLFIAELTGNSGDGVRRNVLANLSKNTDPSSGWFCFIFHPPILSGIGGQPLHYFTLKLKSYGMTVSAPSKAVLNKLDNPAHAKVSRQHGIDLHG